MALDPIQDQLVRHIAGFFTGHEVEVQTFPGVEPTEIPPIAVATVGPGPESDLWIYMSVGCTTVLHDAGHGNEFMIVSGEQDGRLAILLALASAYHCDPETERLEYGHTFSFGEPWLPDATCHQFLVTIPTIFERALFNYEWTDGYGQFLWLLPITDSEARFLSEHGQEALEHRFEANDIPYWDPRRPSAA
ncbi:MAG: suppressor of fused domain protein [Actinomycetota bacterium]